MPKEVNTGTIPAKPSQRYLDAELLIANGWEPVPLDRGSKGCFLKEWNTRAIDLDEMFERRTSGGVGLRCNNICGIDTDCVDVEMLYDIEQIRLEFFGPTPFERIGRAPRTLHAYGGEINGGTSIKIAKDGETAQVEVLGKNRQFAAYHRHPVTGLPYEWTGEAEPMTSKPGDLPPITQESVTKFIEAVNTLLMQYVIEDGWELIQNINESKIGDPVGVDSLYLSADIGDFTAQDVIDGGLNKVRCGWAGCAHQFDGGMWYTDADGISWLLDFGTGRRHYVEGQEPVTDDTRSEELCDMGQALAGIGIKPGGDFLGKPTAVPEVARQRKTADQALTELLEVYAYNVKTGKVWNVITRSEYSSVAKLREFFPQKMAIGDDDVPVVSMWLQDKVIMHDTVFAPDTLSMWVPGVDNHTSENHLNTYMAPCLGDASLGSPDGFIKHIERIVPGPRERLAVLDWCAAKIKNPEKRLCALLMASPSVFGVGRGLMFEALKRTLGRRYTREVSISKITSKDGQNVYTDWLNEKLLVHIPEVVATDSSHNTVRGHKAAYEVMKEILDPGKDYIEHTEKYKVARDIKIFTSVFVASNHLQCIAIPKDDRRFLVALNAPVRMSKQHREELVAWYSNLDNLAALIEWAKAWTRTVYIDDYMPPDTAGKNIVANASMPPITGELLDILDDMQGDAFYADQVMNHVVIGNDPQGKRLDLYKGILEDICRENFRNVHRGGKRHRVKVTGRDSAIYPWLRMDRIDAKRADKLSKSNDLLKAEFKRNTVVMEVV